MKLERGDYGSPADYRPIIDRPVHSDSAFTTVQTIRPHVYNTATWRRAGCDLNISHFVRPHQIFQRGEGRPVDLFPLIGKSESKTENSVSSDQKLQMGTNKPHRFAVHEKHKKWPRMTMRLFGK